RSNPHNPTGRLADPDDTAAVWDEAFYPLAAGRWTRGDDAVVVGSLTKLFACPGLRVGYVVAADQAMALTLASHQPEWSVNALACAIVPELLGLSDLVAWANAITTARAELVDLLHAHELEPEPSDSNFVLVPNAPGLRTHLALHAVLVRDTTNFGFAGGVRIAVPDLSGLDRLARALKGYP
ncbi:MAG TPA: aminotransferase class I/II-fold pyridoxal phosphate-dependent enzyme, partial [Acidimicrobiia bacterium]